MCKNYRRRVSSAAAHGGTFIASEHFFPWFMFQIDVRNDGTCDGNAKEIFDCNSRLCLRGRRTTACNRGKGRRKGTDRKTQFFAKSPIGGGSWAKGRTECQSRQA